MPRFASSKTTMPYFSQIAFISSSLALCPAMCEMKAHFSFLWFCSFTTFSRASGLMLKSSSSISTKIGSASKCLTAWATLGKAFTEQMTLSPRFVSIALSARWCAAAMLFVVITNLAPKYSFSFSSNLATVSVVFSECKASSISSLSRSVIVGL